MISIYIYIYIYVYIYIYRESYLGKHDDGSRDDEHHRRHKLKAWLREQQCQTRL